MNLFKRTALAALILFACAPAFAQWQTPNHSMSVGRGSGVTGFGSAGPCLAGVPFVGAGVSADPTCGPLNLGATGSVTGNLPVANLNGATGAGVNTFWRGDGTWGVPSSTGAGSSVLTYGAKGDGVTVSATVTIASGSSALTASGAAFLSSDVGKTIAVPGAGTAGAALVTTIASYTSPSQIGLAAAAATTVSATTKSIFYGTDDTAAFNAAFTVGGVVNVPCSTYLVSSTMTFAKNGTALIGGGRGCATVKTVSATATMFNAGGSLSNTQISHITLDSAVTGTSGQFGIDYFPSTAGAYITDVAVFHQFIGMRLSNTDFSTVENSFTNFNQSYGIWLTNGSGGSVAAQWQINNVLSEANVGAGIYYLCTGTGSLAVGQVNGFATFANSSYGYAAQGTSTCPVNGIRVINSFFGQDGNSEIYLQTYSTYPHTFTAVSVELAGTTTTGPTLGTVASHVGHGFQISSVEPLVSIVNSTIVGNSQHGITNAGSSIKVTGGTITNNSQASSGTYYGIATAGPLVATNLTVSGSSQAYGISLVGGSDYSVVANNDLRGNGTGGLANPSGATHSIVSSNLGYNPVGGHAISVGATPFTYTAGPGGETVFVSGGTVTGINVNGQTAFGAATDVAVALGPNGTITVAYSAAPTMNGVQN